MVLVEPLLLSAPLQPACRALGCLLFVILEFRQQVRDWAEGHGRTKAGTSVCGAGCHHILAVVMGPGQGHVVVVQSDQ